MNKARIIIIKGNKGEGKTSKLQEIVDKLHNKKINVSGFLARAIITDGKRDSYQLFDITTKKETILCTSNPSKDYLNIRNFYFNPTALSIGESILEKTNDKIIIIDEIGPFELMGLMWNDLLLEMIRKKKTIIVSVRNDLINQVIKKYTLNNYSIWNYNDDTDIIINEIINSE